MAGIASILAGAGGGRGAGIARAISTAAPIAIGTGQLISSAIASKRAKDLEPPAIDVSMERFLNIVRQKRRALETGAVGRGLVQPIRDVQAAATVGAVRTGAGLKGISKAQQIAGQQASKLVSGLQVTLGSQLLETERQLETARAQRILDLRRVQQAKQEAKAARRATGGFANLLGGTERLGSVIAGAVQ